MRKELYAKQVEHYVKQNIIFLLFQIELQQNVKGYLNFLQKIFYNYQEMNGIFNFKVYSHPIKLIGKLENLLNESSNNVLF